ncbi:SGNH/GDSL hydrolase family protein [Ramlibacter sp.]|uniref:SGNH/GDSL hydrolase family protein n=1 Tax=Ramlibacter sp. TaxID=1917967 RepID=UPI002B82CB86|nr:SGNH/GDSL hydrolase family protein [Ramlibacter sp.]HWI82798.1 SGNH/GDSL hydrolase family protein [Ramlibacter sp.]
MSCLWKRRALLALASAAALLLAACGSGTIESQLQPSRVVSFGDAFTDVGQSGSRYTVNDGGIDTWTQQVAVSFGLGLAPASAGGTSYATGNARIAAKPDAAGNAATPTVTEQIDAFLAKGPIGANDLLIVNGGFSDIIAEAAKVTAGTQTRDQAIEAAKQAGRDLAAQVRRLVGAGAQHVVVVGSYDLSRSPWAKASGQGDLLSQASGRFNDQLLVSMVDLGQNVLYVDAPLIFNVMVATPAAYGLSNSTDPVCTSVDPGPGIGIGAGQVNSARCTTATLVAGVDYNQYVFADPVYPTPAAHRRFGEYAYGRIRQRW